MKQLGKALLIVIGIVVLLLCGGLAYLFLAFPKVGPAKDMAVDATPGRIERGRYLANHVAVCIDCHSKRDWDYYSGPVVPGTEGQGGERFGHERGFPGEIYSANITPVRLKEWTDGEIARAITEGVSRDGRAFFPVMPYPSYASLCEEDLASVVAYVRTVPPIPNEVPPTKLDFPLNLIVRTIPKPAMPGPCPDTADPQAYGKYLTTVGGCGDCHTPQKNHKPAPGMGYAGGFEFPLPGGVVRSANITPDTETGIGSWNLGAFITRFKAVSPEKARAMELGAGDMSTVMPWSMYSGMTEQDLGAIFAYLRTIPPVKNKVIPYTRGS